MKSIRLLVFFFLSAAMVNAQNGNLVIFCQDNYPFKIIVNGLENSNVYSNRAVIENLPANIYKIRVDFQEEKIEDINQAIKINANKEITYEIAKRNIAETEKKVKVIGQNMARDFWLKEKDEASKRKEEILNKDFELSLKYLSTLPLIAEKKKEIEPQTPTQVTKETPPNNVVKENVNSLEVVSLNGSIGDLMVTENNIVGETEVQPLLAGYTGKKGCPIPVGDNVFADIKKSISAMQKGDIRFKQTEKLLKANCLLSTQVREVLLMFDFEEDRLSLAKLAYSTTFDSDNYPLLFDLFTFQSSTSELEKFINLKK